MGMPKSKTPAVPPPAAIPEVGADTEDWAMKQARRRKGFESTLMTGSLKPKPAGKKITLG